MSGPLLYYITDRSRFPGDESARRAELLVRVRAAAEAGVDYIQLRERDLSARELESLAREAMRTIAGTSARLLINHRADVAIAAGALISLGDPAPDGLGWAEVVVFASFAYVNRIFMHWRQGGIE